MTQKVSSTMLASSGTMPAWDGSALTGISTNAALTSVKANLALNFFLDSIDSSRAIQYLADGFVDQFEDQTGVDDPNSTGETYDAGSDYYGNGGTPGTPGVPVDSNDILYIKSNTTDGSTTFTDSSLSPRTITAHGDTHHDTGYEKFGTTSLCFDGTGDYLSLTDSNSWTFPADFTVELWLRTTGTGGHHNVITKGNTDTSWAPLEWHFDISVSTGVGFWQMSNNGSGNGAVSMGGSTDIADELWHHVAIVRHGNTVTMYIDGVAEATGAFSGTMLNGATQLYIGTGGNLVDFFNGYMEEIRISNTARYTAAFTPHPTFLDTTAPDGTPSNMTLVSEPVTAIAAPNNAHVTLFKEDVDAVTTNTDLLAWASRSKQTITATNATNVLNATAHGLSDNDRVMVLPDSTASTRMVTFGSSTVLARGSAFTGAVDSDTFTMSFLMRPANDGTTRIILADGGTHTLLNLTPGNQLHLYIEDAHGASVGVEITTTDTFLAGNLYHVAIEVDLSAGVANIYRAVNGGAIAATTLTTGTAPNLQVGGNISWTDPVWYVGFTSSYYTGDLGTYYLNIGVRIDLTNSANMEKFYKDGISQNLGSDGSTPTGTAPILFLNNPASTWHTNLGTGGGMSLTGTLAAGTDAPGHSLPAGLDSETVYHVVTGTTNTLQVSLTSGGSAVALTTDGSGTNSVSAVTPVTLVDESTYDVYDIVSGTADISGQPSGTNMNLVVQTKNNKDVKIHGQSLQWS